MKRTLLCSAIFLASHTHAGSAGVNLGSSLTTGPSSNSYSLSAASNNPAMASLVVDKDESLRMSYFPNLGVALEIGEVDNFIDDLEELTDILDDPNSTSEPVSDVLDRFNGVLVEMGESGYLKNSVALNAPFFPLFIDSDFLGGALGLSISAEAIAGISILDDPLSYNNVANTFETSSAIYLKAGVEKTAGITYSRELPINNWLDMDLGGKLYAGVKVKAMNLELSKQVLALENLESDDISDIIKDEYDNNQVSSTELGLDLGLVWDAGDYRIGMTAENINSPEFKYGEIGNNCSNPDLSPASQTNCNVAAYFAYTKGEIKANETHTKDAYFRGDILYKLTERWQVSSAMDFAEYNDVIGFENQWLHVATSYDADSWIIPSVRLGYHSNLAGTKTSSASMGFTLFNLVALDFEYGLESIEVDGSEAPRRAGFSLSIEESF